MELENTAKQRLEELQKEVQETAEKRKKQLMKREVPTRRTLKNALAAMTRQELDDIRYNIGLSGTSGMNKAELIEKLVPAWREVASTALAYGIPAPTMTSALSYFDGYTTARLPANLLQAQRDYFGAHTYERLDAPRGQFFHTNWTGHGGSTSAATYNA